MLGSKRRIFRLLGLQRYLIVWQQLEVRDLPETEAQQEKGSVLEIVEDCFGELFVVRWRSLVNVVKHVYFLTVDDQISRKCDREQDGQTNAKHHSDEGHVHQKGVFEVDEVLRAGVNVHVLLF